MKPSNWKDVHVAFETPYTTIQYWTFPICPLCDKETGKSRPAAPAPLLVEIGFVILTALFGIACLITPYLTPPINPHSIDFYGRVVIPKPPGLLGEPFFLVMFVAASAAFFFGLRAVRNRAVRMKKHADWSPKRVCCRARVGVFFYKRETVLNPVEMNVKKDALVFLFSNAGYGALFRTSNQKSTRD